MKKYICLFCLFFVLSIGYSQVHSQEAQNYYEQGQLNEAKIILQESLKTSESNQSQIITLLNLALIAQELENWSEYEQALEEANILLETLDNSQEKAQLLAQLLDVRGQGYLSRGEYLQAREIWQQSASIYQDNGNYWGLINSQIYQAEALKLMGLYSQANYLLLEIAEDIPNLSAQVQQAKALFSLGDTLRRMGQYQQSQVQLEQSLAIAQAIGSTQLIADNLFNLGLLANLQANPEQAFSYYQQAVASSTRIEIKIRGNIKLVNLLIEADKIDEAKLLIAEIESLIPELNSTSLAIHSYLSLADSLLTITSNQIPPGQILNHLTTALDLSNQIDYQRGVSEALGKLGFYYEKNQRVTEAQQLTQKALSIAEQIQARDLSYQWQWQLGRIFKAQNLNSQAIIAYTQAIQTLQSIRNDLLTSSPELQYSFRESVEPIYRELVGLLLQPGATQEQIRQARDTIDALQIAELDNFFRDACLDIQPVAIEEVDDKAASIYPIILADRLEVIAAIPGQPLRHYTTNLSQEEITRRLGWVNSELQNPNRAPREEFLQDLYDWLIEPIEADLKLNQIQTLVFVLDGGFRNIPPATFFDGEQYLIEKYNIAIAPSLQLLDPQPFTLGERQLLLAGLTEARQGFTELPGVKEELENIQQQVPSSILLNQNFIQPNFQQAVETSPYQIIHLATHGQFSSKIEETFLLTWDDRLTIDQLNSLLSSDQKSLDPVELLVLSACQTAQGDDRATLGLAGIAVRAGARSTIASLWEVSDRSTSILMTQFYRELTQNNISKAEALGRAQRMMLQEDRYQHPYYWSAFMLLGNWF